MPKLKKLTQEIKTKIYIIIIIINFLSGKIMFPIRYIITFAD